MTFTTKPIIYDPNKVIEIDQGEMLIKIIHYLNDKLPIGNTFQQKSLYIGLFGMYDDGRDSIVLRRSQAIYHCLNQLVVLGFLSKSRRSNNHKYRYTLLKKIIR